MAETYNPITINGPLPSGTELLASAARTATTESRPFHIWGGAVGISIRIDASAASATPSVIPTVEAWDPVAGEWFVVLTGAAIIATGSVVLTVDPRMTAVTNLTAQSPIYSRMKLVMTAADSDSLTYSAYLSAHK